MAWSAAIGIVLGCLALTASADAAPAKAAAPAPEAAPWQHTLEVPRPPRRGKPQSPAVAHLWLPEKAGAVRGLVLAGKTSLEKGFCRDPLIRAAAADEHVGVLYFEPALDAVFDYVNNRSGRRLEDALAALAAKSGHPELAGVPWLTVGHSTGGIFARNVAFWKPDRVIGIVHIKSGNFQDGLWDPTRTIAGVPFLAINGEFEEYGPKGGDLGRGLRSAYSLHPADKRKKNQTQWVMIRMQMLARRRRNPSNLMSLVIHRGRGHGGWDEQLSRICAQFLRSAAEARIPAGGPGGGAPVRCKPVRAEDGWLTDADVKDPEFGPAPYARYKGDKALAFWHLDGTIARMIETYHAGKWEYPDPTAGQPPEQRYTPPPILRDAIDAPRSQDKPHRPG